MGAVDVVQGVVIPVESIIWDGVDPVMVLHVVIGVVLPALVGLVSTRLTHPGIKAMLLIGLTIATNVLAELAQALVIGTPFRVVDVVVIAAAQFMWSTSVHFGVLKPGKMSDWLAEHGVKADPAKLEAAEDGADVVTTEGTVTKPELARDLKNADLITPLVERGILTRTANEQTMDDWDTVAKDRRAGAVNRLPQDVQVYDRPLPSPTEQGLTETYSREAYEEAKADEPRHRRGE